VAVQLVANYFDEKLPHLVPGEQVRRSLWLPRYYQEVRRSSAAIARRYNKAVLGTRASSPRGSACHRSYRWHELWEAAVR